MLYTASKGAIEQITRVLARDLGSRQITINCISPGPIDTDMFRDGKSEEMISFHRDIHPSKRLGLPEEVSGIVALLAGPGGSWINGQTIGVNGVGSNIVTFYLTFNHILAYRHIVFNPIHNACLSSI